MDFLLLVASGSSAGTSIGTAVIKIIWVAVGILFLSHLEVEIILGALIWGGGGIFTPSLISNIHLKTRIRNIKVKPLM